MTERLYYRDSYLTRFEASVIAGGREVVLDRTAFYPTSGGQPNDLGRLGEAAVLDVIDEEGRGIVHVVDKPLQQGAMVAGEIDWRRRFDHMQQHTGQHLLSAVFHDLFGWATLSFHLGAETSTIDLSTAAARQEEIEKAEREANARITENLGVRVGFEQAETVEGLRKASERSGELRIVTIEGLDRSACGGTHVRSTGEIGCLLIRKLEKVRGVTRVEFVCGGRAVARARADYNALAAAARHFSAALDETPGLVAGLIEQAKESEKARKRLALELASVRGRELYASTEPGAGGARVRVERAAALDDELRAFAQSFTAQAGARLIAVCEQPPSVLYAVSEGEAPAGARLKPVLDSLGGRGGGNARLAQGSLPDAATVERAVEALLT